MLGTAAFCCDACPFTKPPFCDASLSLDGGVRCPAPLGKLSDDGACCCWWKRLASWAVLGWLMYGFSMIKADEVVAIQVRCLDRGVQ